MFAGRSRLAFFPQTFQRRDQAHAAFFRFDDIIQISTRGGQIGVGEFFPVLAGFFLSSQAMADWVK